MKKFNRQRLILLNELGGTFDGFTGEQVAGMETAMTKFAVNEIGKFKTREINKESINFFKVIYKLNWDITILYMRYLVFERTKRKAKLRAKTEGYKMYVIRDSRIGYRILSTLDIKVNQSIRVIKKNVAAKDLEKNPNVTIILPGKDSNPGQGFTSSDIKDVVKDSSGTNSQPKKKRTKKK